ncbi:MAG TPA: Abi-alpha family protein [Sedimentisphaerales bacterium]|nr:Abi-alpha family protein [Sedimentisphaerales bacterium]
MNAPEESQALGKALEAAKGYADAVVKGPLSEFGGILSDTVGYWRLKNQVRLMLRAKRWLEERGVKPEKLLPDVFVPLLDDGGNVEDETLSDMFASLLAGHLDPHEQGQVHPSYTKVLVQLSPLDAKLMLAFRGHVSDKVARESGLRGHVLTADKMAEEMGIPKRATYLSCLNLARLGIVEQLGYRSPEGHPVPGLFEDSLGHQLYRMSEYGVAFCDACQYPK